MASGLALVIAAVVGATLNAFGAYLNDYFTRRRDDKRENREDQRRREQWEREQCVREEEQKREDARQLAEKRLKSYKDLVAATFHTFGLLENQLVALNESHLEAQLYASPTMQQPAADLYKAAMTYFMPETSSTDAWEDVLQEQQKFWQAAQVEAVQTNGIA